MKIDKMIIIYCVIGLFLTITSMDIYYSYPNEIHKLNEYKKYCLTIPEDSLLYDEILLKDDLLVDYGVGGTCYNYRNNFDEIIKEKFYEKLYMCLFLFMFTLSAIITILYSMDSIY